MLEEHPDFSEEFKRVFDNCDITPADGYTTEMLEYTCVDIDIAPSIYGEGTFFSKVTKHMQDENVIPIVRHHENPMLNSRHY